MQPSSTREDVGVGSRLVLAGVALTTAMLPLRAVAAEPELDDSPREVQEPEGPRIKSGFTPIALVSFGGGARLDERLGTFGGDVLVGVQAYFGRWGEFVVIPTLGWSGWRTLERPSRLRANTFTARLDLGYMNASTHMQGVTLSLAGRVGGGRSLEQVGRATSLYDLQAGVAWWPYQNVVGLEFQPHFTHHRGVWETELRGMVTVNVVRVALGIFALAMSPSFA